jgi:hypothetical protein
MPSEAVSNNLNAAITHGDVATARRVLTEHAQEISADNDLNRYLRAAARKDQVRTVSLLVEFGADIHAPDGHGDPPAPEGVLDDAASNGAINVVRWLLEHGSRLNYEVNGKTRCLALSGAVIEGHLDVVRLLVEHGAAINAVWAGKNALSFAILYGQKAIEEYLRSQGAVEPTQLGNKQETSKNPIVDHIKKYFGKPEPLALREIVPNDPSIAIHVARKPDRLALVTNGMSARPMVVPKGREDLQFAELVMCLPPDWLVGEKALQDANYGWPYHWLRPIGRYPHQNQTWLGGPVAIFANGEPPAPLAPNTKLSCLLAITSDWEGDWLHLPGGKVIAFYSVYPLFTEERDLEKQKGVEHLLKLFQEHDISMTVDLNRVNVAKVS